MKLHVLTTALLLTGVLLTTGCTIEDTAIDNPVPMVGSETIQFTATLAPREGATTRAITVSNQNTDNETLDMKWKKGEKIALYYETIGYIEINDNDEIIRSHASTTATVENVDETTGVATITATLENALDGGTVKFVYPASLVNATGDDIDEDKLLKQQNGLLRTGTTNISKNFDAATQTGKVSVSGSTAFVNDTIMMESRVCICRIELNFNNGSNLVSSGGKTLTIAVGNERTYTISSPKTSDIQSPDQPIQYEPFKTGDVIYVAMLPVVSQRVTFLSFDGSIIYRFISNDVNLSAGKFYRNIPLTLTQITTATRTLTAETNELTLQDGDIVSGTGGANTQLKIADGATVFLRGVTNTGITQEASIPGIKCEGDATIILAGTNSVTGRWIAAGIFVPEGHTLTILGSGTLHATGGSDGAGIGGTQNRSCGNIRIEGGTITATGTGYCAGIGSGWANVANITCGDITISGGTVTATGGAFAAGIGSGSGNDNHDNHTVYVSPCGVISIKGGTVTATGGSWASGIGSGWYGKFASISIGNDITSVTATRSNNNDNVPIGKGYKDQGSGAVTIDGQVLTDAQMKGTENATYGGINVAVSAYGTEGLTWTLTRKN